MSTFQKLNKTYPQFSFAKKGGGLGLGYEKILFFVRYNIGTGGWQFRFGTI